MVILASKCTRNAAFALRKQHCRRWSPQQCGKEINITAFTKVIVYKATTTMSKKKQGKGQGRQKCHVEKSICAEKPT